MSTNEQQARSVSRRVTRGFDPVKLAELRTNRRITRSDLARLAEVGESTLHHWERGTRSPQVDLLARVVAKLDATVQDVVSVPDAETFPGDLRVRAGLTQPELGRLSGIGTSSITRIERGQAALTSESLDKLSAVLKVSSEAYQAAYDRVRARPAGTPS
ncbi:helix-turn-helix domain-containing protein [Rhodococcoides fascians]|uniref:helix-turn-helix domain-containing protein n=1 Tax=Rhodococcoides fascians TaxID=1828 RepID=UPI0006917268|nr:helix-turn-helix transcriptional regulator [Rhodococcus fascians]